jgi:hypothetical protein
VPPEPESPHALIEPSVLIVAKAPPTAQSRRGVTQVMEVQVHPLVVATPRFMQRVVPLLSLKLMVQSRRGVIRLMEA